MSRHRKDCPGPQKRRALGHGLCVNPSQGTAIDFHVSHTASPVATGGYLVG